MSGHTAAVSQMVRFTERLQAALHDVQALDDLRHYYNGECFTGGRWDDLVQTLDPDVIGPADAAVTALLSVGVTLRGDGGKASAWGVVGLVDDGAWLAERLRQVPQTPLHLVDDFDATLGPGTAAVELYGRLRETLRISGRRIEERRVAVSKMLAGKRPYLIPVLDGVVARYLTGHNVPGDWWRSWWVTMQDQTILSQLEHLRQNLGRPNVALLRTADVVVWMRQRGRLQCRCDRRLV